MLQPILRLLRDDQVKGFVVEYVLILAVVAVLLIADALALRIGLSNVFATK